MDEGYTWREMREEGPSHLPGPDHLGWWVGVALLLAIILHAVAFLALGRIKVALGFEEAEEMRTAPMNVEQVEVIPETAEPVPPEPVPQEPQETAKLLDEIDVLSQLPEDTELDMTPQTIDPEFAVKPEEPRASGAPAALDTDAAADFDLDAELPDMGRTEDPLPMAREGQVIVDPGQMEVDDPALDDFTSEILKKGADGSAAQGTLDGMVSLDDMVGLSEDVLVGKKTMLPSDLLFEYDSAKLRESARVGLMKLALLIERNPNLFCWIEGHTDLYGDRSYNLELSRERARSVKNYLTESLRLPESHIITRGFGKSRPIVADGSVEEQAPNRRVEIRMRRERPAETEIAPAAPDEAAEDMAAAESEPAPPDPEMETTPEPAPPKARAVEEPEAPKAVPIEEDAPRALPVEEDEEARPPRAVPVGD